MSNQEIVEGLFNVQQALCDAGRAICKCRTLVEVNYRKWPDARDMLIAGLAEIESAHTCFKGILENELFPGTVVKALGSDSEYVDMVVASIAMQEFDLPDKLRQAQDALEKAKRVIPTCCTLAEAGYRDWTDLQGALDPLYDPTAVPEYIEQAYLMFRTIIEKDLLPGIVIEPQKPGIANV